MRQCLWALTFSASLVGGVPETPALVPAAIPAPAPRGPALVVPGVYFLRPTEKEGACLVSVDEKGHEVCIAALPQDAYDKATRSYVRQTIGAFAPTPDGEAVLFLTYRLSQSNTPSVGAALAAAVPGVGVLGAAILGGIGGAIDGANSVLKVSCTGISLWERRTGKTQVLWDVEAIESAGKGWLDPTEAQATIKTMLMTDLDNYFAATHLFPLRDRNFLLATPASVVQVDIPNHKLLPQGINLSREAATGVLAWQGEQGQLRFRQSNRIIGIDPDGTRKEVSLRPLPVTFLGSDDLLIGDGEEVTRLRLQGDTVTPAGSFKLKHERLIPGEGSKYFFAYQHRSFGSDRLSKVDLEGKVLWTASLGSCKSGIALGEAGGKVWALVEPGGVDSLPLRLTLDASNGAVKAKDLLFNGCEAVPDRRVISLVHAREWPETLTTRRLLWFPATQDGAKTQTGWVPSIAPSTEYFPDTSGMLAYANPDFTLQPVSERSRAQRLVIPSSVQALHFEPFIATQRLQLPAPVPMVEESAGPPTAPINAATSAPAVTVPAVPAAP